MKFLINCQEANQAVFVIIAPEVDRKFDTKTLVGIPL